MNIIITTRKQHPVSDEVLFTLMQQSYQQWIDAGIQAAWLHRTLDDFSEVIRNQVVFLAVTENDESLLGMHCFNCYPRKHYAHGFYLAVDPKYKREGIASRMLKEEVIQLRQRGYRYIKGKTSAAATWSVRWHLKNGYRIKGYSMGRAPYSGSYQFRLQLATFSWRHPSTWLWNKPLAPITARLCYLASYTIAQLVHHRNGELNWIGRLGKKLKDVRCMMEDGRCQLWFMING